MDKEKTLLQYDNLLKDIARKSKVNHYDYDDILQELRMVALSCMNRFDPSKGVKFSTYLSSSCHYKIKELRMKNRHTHDSLDNQAGEGTSYIDILQDTQNMNPEEKMLYEDMIQVLDELPNGHVTKMYYIDGMTQIEIADALGMSKSYINKVNRKNIKILKEMFEWQD